MTYPPFGKSVLSSILCKGDFLKPIINALWFPAKLSDPDPVIPDDAPPASKDTGSAKEELGKAEKDTEDKGTPHAGMKSR